MFGPCLYASQLIFVVERGLLGVEIPLESNEVPTINGYGGLCMKQMCYGTRFFCFF